jgi:sporulation protein YlmC with PRC-barrel domain
MRASKMIGAKVYDRDNRDIGSVRALVLSKDGQIADVVVGVGGFLGVADKDVALSLSDINLDNNRLTLDRTKAQLRQAANYRLQDCDSGARSSSVPVTGGCAGSAATLTPPSSSRRSPGACAPTPWSAARSSPARDTRRRP